MIPIYPRNLHPFLPAHLRFLARQFSPRFHEDPRTSLVILRSIKAQNSQTMPIDVSEMAIRCFPKIGNSPTFTFACEFQHEVLGAVCSETGSPGLSQVPETFLNG